MNVRDLARRLQPYPAAASVRASVPDGGSSRTLRLKRVGHHRPPADIAAGATPAGCVTVEVVVGGQTVPQVENHPVEIFAEPWDTRLIPAGDLTVGEIMAELAHEHHQDEAMIRVAVPLVSRQHRCLDLVSIGHGAGGEEVNGELVVEIVTGRWDDVSMTIRDDE